MKTVKPKEAWGWMMNYCKNKAIDSELWNEAKAAYEKEFNVKILDNN